MDKTNADYIIEELKQINFPMPREKMEGWQLDEITNQLDEIEKSISIYRKHLSRFNPNKQQSL